MKIQKNPLFSFICSKINLLNNNKLSDMQEWEKESIKKAKVQLYPTFYKKAPEIQLLDNLENAYKAFKSFEALSRKIHLDMLKSERGKEILATAEEYNIPYNKDDIDWLHLINQIENYEELLQQAKDINLIWDAKNYDPIELKQLIEDDFLQERKWARELNSDYLDSRL